jgi:hypothetical protein
LSTADGGELEYGALLTLPNHHEIPQHKSRFMGGLGDGKPLPIAAVSLQFPFLCSVINSTSKQNNRSTFSSVFRSRLSLSAPQFWNP